MYNAQRDSESNLPMHYNFYTRTYGNLTPWFKNLLLYTVKKTLEMLKNKYISALFPRFSTLDENATYFYS